MRLNRQFNFMKIKGLPESERPMEKAINQGVEKLSNSELLALIINSGREGLSAVDLAQSVMGIYPEGISQLGEATYEELINIKGIGPSKAIRLLSTFQIGRRIATSGPRSRKAIKSNDDVAELFMEELRYEKKEHFITLLLNSKGEILDIDKVSIGELSSTIVHPREVFSKAIKKSAASIILVHNHPSGDPSPSQEDIRTTIRLIEGGKLLGIKVLDHIIIGHGEYVSLKALDII